MLRFGITVMLLAIDVGNTHSVIGIYAPGDTEKPSHLWRIATCITDTVDDLRGRFLPLLAEDGVDVSCVDRAVYASVVPPLSQSWVSVLSAVFGVEAKACSAQLAYELGLFSSDYPRPSEIGADRVADAVAAKALYGSPIIVVDFGTATNIEVIDADGAFVGGIIAPGIETSATALFSHARRLAMVDLVAPEAAIGTSTEEAIRSGIVLGEADRVDGLIRRIHAQLGYQAPAVATGGLASLVCAHTELIDHVNPYLTLAGLKLLAEASGDC